MVLKWILLLLITWYVFKALGNLILTLRGVPIESPRPSMPEREERRPVTKPTEYKAEVSRKPEIEDARFKDL